MIQPINILVTAVGSELAFSVIKACKLFSSPVHIIGCDMHDQVIGKYWTDKFFNVPAASETKSYVKRIGEIVQLCNVNFIIPTADVEFSVLAPHKDNFRKMGCHILVNDPEELERFNDKWLAAKWYVNKSIPAPQTYQLNEFNEFSEIERKIEFPLIIKPRRGGGSRSIFRVNNVDELEKMFPVVEDPILQEYLAGDDEEYTAGVYKYNDSKVFVIILKRTLKFGMTNSAETITDRPDLEIFCQDVITKTKLIGSNNIQFRVTSNGPKVLEINPRFSGTTGIRAHFGFNDVEMWVKNLLGVDNLTAPQVKKGIVLRFMEELYITY